MYVEGHTKMRLSHEDMCGTGMKGLEANTVGDKVRRLRKFILYSALSTKPKTLTFTKEL